MRKLIYKQFIVVDDKLEDEFQNSLSKLLMEEALKQVAFLKRKMIPQALMLR